MLDRLQIEHRQLGVINLTNRKAIGLLVYLLIESDHEYSCEFLLGLLWPDLPTPAAENNLRFTWAHLRKALGICIGKLLDQVAQEHVTAVLDRARGRLGDVAFGLALSKGANLTAEQAIPLALS